MKINYMMGRRRLRFIIAAFLLSLRDSLCQNENDFFYTPVERSFAQVQPPLFPSNRPSTYFDNGDNFRVQPSVTNTAQQSLYNDGHDRFPSPNYNQNPSPFQLPTGRSQAGNQYYLNQPEFGTPHRQRYRPALPHNYQLVHPASTTKRPDLTQIHSYQHDPSKPETFLGQVTLNNPDLDYLQNNRYKNIQFDENSLRSTTNNNHGLSNDDDIDNDNHDLFDHHRVTTYNPNKNVNRQRIVKPTGGRFSHFEPTSTEDKHNNQNTPVRNTNNNDKKIRLLSNTGYRDSSTEYKSILDIEPLLEDDISDISSFRELMKNNKGSDDVQVIKQNNSAESKYDSNPASSIIADNIAKHNLNLPEVATITHVVIPTTENHVASLGSQKKTESLSKPANEPNNQSTEVEEDVEYEYYEDIETTPEPRTTQKSSPLDHPDDYDDYETNEEVEHSDEQLKTNSTSFDVLVMKPVNTSVNEDNFKSFKDTTAIDQTVNNSAQNLTEPHTAIKNENEEQFTSVETPVSYEDNRSSAGSKSNSNEQTFSNENSSILGQEIVSVVTTKSVVNGTISVPNYHPSTPKTEAYAESAVEKDDSASIPVTTENWVVVASVQTSRSVSGARFLPFPAVEQEEKKQVLTDDKSDENDDVVTRNPAEVVDTLIQDTTSISIENINDKLDSIQSELSSGVLSGSLDSNDKNIEIIKESATKPTTTSTTMPTPTTLGPVNIFTLKSTQIPLTTERSAPEPLPVLIKKFAPKASTTSTTPKPKKKLVTVMDELPPGFLPPGYRPRASFKDKRTSTTSTTTTTTTTTTVAPTISSSSEDYNATQARSINMGSKNKVILLDQKSTTIAKDAKESKLPGNLFKKLQFEDISKLLPPGYKPPSSDPANVKVPDILEKAQKIDISSFLPKGFSLNDSSSDNDKLPVKIIPVDVSAFLPPGFVLNKTEKKNTTEIINKFKTADLSNLLPPGFNLNQTELTPTLSTTKNPGGFKLVFPSRPGNKQDRKSTTPKSVLPSGPSLATPKIQQGWPQRASTEFTGWPSPSTTPFSIEKLLEAQRNATATSPMPGFSTEVATRRTTTTTTSTALPPPSTTPGVCKKECDLAATIKLVSGVQWLPELLDPHTDEWKQLADDVKEELNSVYSKSDLLKKWYKGIRIDGFTQGSVLVDYFIELNNITENVNTLELKKLFHQSLVPARARSIGSSRQKEVDFDPDAMQGDQPGEERSNEHVDYSLNTLEIGKFVMDPAYTEFIVVPKREDPVFVETEEEESLLPQWGIAVIVIAMASLLFVVIFGVTVLVNRQKSAKAKQPIPLSDDMFRELDKNHMGGFEDLHPVKEREPPYHGGGKRMSSAFIEQLAYQNPGDSWRSEWTPQLQKHMQHYTPDSGRGSQIYGASGNIYGYGGGGGSQLYGQTGGSQLYGYTGEYPPRSHYPRRRSDYDDNF